jgi:hypothetical protein
LFVLDCIDAQDDIRNLLTTDGTDEYYALLATSYDDADDDVKKFWSVLMFNLMPHVSKDWQDRLRGTRIAEGDEEVSRYVTSSDFAYIPMVIKIYGERELAQMSASNQRTRGRTKGQSGMMCKKSIDLYCKSIMKMKKVLDDEMNRDSIREWSDAIFEEIRKNDMNPVKAIDRAMEDLAEAARAAVELDIRRVKRDEIIIPV